MLNRKLVTVRVPPSSLMRTFSTMRVPGWSSLVIVQTASSPAATVTVSPSTCVPPVHTHALASYVAGPPLSERPYVPGGTPAFVTAESPSEPDSGVGPEAESVQSVSTAVPPWSFTTTFSSVRWVEQSSFQTMTNVSLVMLVSAGLVVVGVIAAPAVMSAVVLWFSLGLLKPVVGSANEPLPVPILTALHEAFIGNGALPAL